MRWGYTCSSEEFEASDLVRLAGVAEDAGFDFVTVSDHFHPWTSEQGHSPFVWTTIGGIAARTSTVRIGTGVTCPIIRYHPAIVAQAAASSSEISNGRFFLGVGTGEALNEHITGSHWPVIETRQQMLAEAVSVMRALWEGESVDFVGEYYTLENAKLFSPPPFPLEVVWAASGKSSARLAAENADALWSTSPDKDTVDAYREAGGDGDVIGQLTVCWDPDEDAAIETAHRIWPNAAIAGQLSQDLPTWSHFEQAAQTVRPEDVARSVICGASVERLVDGVREFLDAGFTAVHFHQIGPEQQRFVDAWRAELSHALQEVAVG